MLTFIMILVIIACVVLVLVILAQNPKGGGLSPTFGGGMGNPVLGARKTADVLEKATWYIGAGILVVVLISSSFLPTGHHVEEVERSRLEEQAPYMMQPQQQQQQQPQQRQQQPPAGQQPQTPGDATPGDAPEFEIQEVPEDE